MERESKADQVVAFIKRIKSQNSGAAAANVPPPKTAAEIEEEKRMAEKARIANERANAFLKNRNNA